MSKLFCLPVAETDFYEAGDDPNFIYIEIDFLLEKSILSTFQFLKGQGIFGTLDIENENMTRAINLISHLDDENSTVKSCDPKQYVKTLQIIHAEDQQSIVSLIQPNQCLHVAQSYSINIESLVNYKDAELMSVSCSHPAMKSTIDANINLFSGEILFSGNAMNSIDASKLVIHDEHITNLSVFNNPHFDDKPFLTPLSLHDLQKSLSNTQDMDGGMQLR